MILVTVGMQLGFDRLIKAMDQLAPSLGDEMIAQTGKGTYQPQHMQARKSIAPAEFEAMVNRCRLVVSHAGIGTVLTAQRFAKPIVLFPRRYEHGEHRNDHQIATARNLKGRSGILVAMDEQELRPCISEGLSLQKATAKLSPSVKELRAALSGFIEGRDI